MKPHKGRIEFAEIKEFPGGYVYEGKFLDHPVFMGKTGHTSKVIRDDKDLPRHNGDSYEIETLNSRYTILPSVQTGQDPATAEAD